MEPLRPHEGGILIRGLILAGGKSSRFGSDKAMATYGGTRLIDRAASILDSFGLRPVVSLRFGADYPDLPCSTVVYDQWSDRGPLGGIYSAMSMFRDLSFLVLTCDMPALTHAVIADLLNIREPRPQLAVYFAAGRIQPFPGIYGPGLFEIMRENMKRDRFSLNGLITAAGDRKTIEWRGDPSVFLNVNRQEDLIANSGPHPKIKP
jgi:molybdopterin-guanine dinucleotide biosynthesis protein A